MAPDFEYFIWMSPNAYLSHSIHGIYLFDLPLTFLFAFLYHIVIKRPLLYHFPFFKNKYLLPPFDYAAYLRKNWGAFILSALIGIVTHLFWDAFTHGQGYFVQHNNYLYEEMHIGSLAIRRCYVAWYISSIGGLIIVMLYALDMKKLFSKNIYMGLGEATGKYWAMILFVTIGLLVLRTWLGLTWNWFRHLIIIAIGAFMYALIMVSWFEKERLKRMMK